MCEFVQVLGRGEVDAKMQGRQINTPGARRTLSVLALAPATLARQLVLLRFNRDTPFKPMRQAGMRLRNLMHRTP